MKAKTLLIGLMAAFATVLAACGGGNSSSKVPSIPSSSVPTPSPSTPTPSVSTPAPSVSTPAPSVSTPTPSVSTPAVSTPDVDPDPTPDPIVPDAPVEGNLFVATGWEEADELQADVNEGANIVYWADTNWSGSIVTATTSVEDGIFSIDSTLTSGSCWHGLQAFINVPNNAAGDEYDVSLTINSSVAGKITFNGQVVDLVEGRNDLSAHVKLASANRWDGVAFVTAPISIQFGVEGAAADANAVVQNGEYKLYNIVVLKTTSVNPEPDPEPENPTPDVPTEGNLFVADGWQEGEELTADENEGAKIIYWADTNWTNSLVTATTSVENGVFTIDGTQVSGYCWHGLQVFMNVPNNAAGDTYDVSFTLNSSVAGQINFNGQVTNIVVGDNELTSTVTVIATNRWDGAPYITAPVSIQFGIEQGSQDANKAMQNGQYSFSNIVILKAENTDNPGETPVDPNPEPEIPGELAFDLIRTAFGEEANTINNSEFKGQAIAYWNDQNWVSSNVVVNASVSNGVATYEVSATPWADHQLPWYGFQLFAVPTGYVAGNTYKVSFDLNSSVTGKINASGQVLEVATGDNHFEIVVTPEANKAPFSVIMGVDGDNENNTIMLNATYKISNLVFEHYVDTPENPEPENPNPETPAGNSLSINRIECYGDWFMKVFINPEGYTYEDINFDTLEVSLSNNSAASLGEQANYAATEGTFMIRIDANERGDANKTTGTSFTATISFELNDGTKLSTEFKVHEGKIVDEFPAPNPEPENPTPNPDPEPENPNPETPAGNSLSINRIECYGDWFMKVFINPEGYTYEDINFDTFEVSLSNNSAASLGEKVNYAATEGTFMIRIDANERGDANKTTGTSFTATISFELNDGTAYSISFNVANGQIA